MMDVRKFLNVFVVLGSCHVFAGTMGTTCPSDNVTIPCKKNTWVVGGQALYLQPTNIQNGAYSLGATQQNYTSQGNKPNFPNDQLQTIGVNPKWSFGFELEGAYQLSTGNEINLNWYHFRNAITKTTDGGVNSAYILSSMPLTPLDGNFSYGILWQGGTYATNADWDQVNLEFAKHVHLGDKDFLRLHAGINYSRVANYSNEITSYSYSNSTLSSIAGTIRSIVSSTSSYNGFGPRLGFDLMHKFSSGLAVNGTLAASVLAGTNTSSLINVVDAPTGTATNSVGLPVVLGQSIVGSHAVIVPELDAKLGVSYDYAMANGDLYADIGWLWANYFSPLYNINANYASQNFGLQGLYFGLRYAGNMV